MNDQDRSILKKFFAGLLVVLVIIALVWFIFFRHTGKKNDSGQAKTTTSHSQPAGDAKASDNAQKVKPSDNKSGTVAAAETEKLVNSGPGDILAIFIGVTVFAALAHRFYYTRIRATDKF
jgi:ATP-dependent Zn protease